MITEWVMSAGDWRLRLKPDCPQDVLALVDAWDHVVVTDQWVDPARFTDAQLKAMAKWAGVVLETPRHGDGRDMAGLGLAVHLGDADGVGDIYESAVANTAETFPNWIRDLLPAGGSIVEGVLSSASGTLTASIRWVTPRQAIDWVCGQFSQPAAEADVEWRVNPDGSLDAGTQADLWITNPAAETLPPLLVARDAGSQPNAHAVPVADLVGQNEAYLRLLKQWVHGTGEGDTLITGSASSASSLKDYHGNALVRTRVTPDSQATVGNITQRAGWLLRSANHTHQRWEADLGDFWVQGQFSLGDWVLLYDQEAGFTDLTHEIDYRGDRIWPKAIRVVGWTWAVSDGMGVYLRDKTGAWTDLTPYLEMEQPSTRLMLGDRPVETTTTDLTGQFIASKINIDGAIPDKPTELAATADTYVNPRGRELAWIIPTWTNPTQNDDGSTLADLDRIEIRFRRNGTSEEWEERSLAAANSGLRGFRRLDPDTVYELQAQARRLNGKVSGWTESATVDTAHDTVVPGKPPTPTLDVSNPTGVLVSVDLTTYGPANPDVTFFPVWGHTANNFAAATRLGRIPVTFAELAAEETISRRFALPAAVLGAAYWLWVKARDDGGNLSPVSDPATCTPGRITNREVAPQGLHRGRMAHNATGNLIANPSGVHMEPEDADDKDPHDYVNGGGAWSADETAGRAARGKYANKRCWMYSYAAGTTPEAAEGVLTLNGPPGTLTDHFAVAPGQVVTFTAWLLRGASAIPDPPTIGILFYDGDGSQVGAVGVACAVTTTWSKFKVSAAAASGAVYAVCQVVAQTDPTDANTQRLYIDDLRATVAHDATYAQSYRRLDAAGVEIGLGVPLLVALGTEAKTGLSVNVTSADSDLVTFADITVPESAGTYLVDLAIAVQVDAVAAGVYLVGFVKAEGTVLNTSIGDASSALTGAQTHDAHDAHSAHGSTGSHNHNGYTGSSSGHSHGIDSDGAHSAHGTHTTHATHAEHTLALAAISYRKYTAAWRGSLVEGGDAKIRVIFRGRSADGSGTLTTAELSYTIWKV